MGDIMKEAIVGLIAGIVGGMGMGGGTILILLLSVFLNVEQHVAQSTNIIFFIPTAIAAIFVNLKQKNIEFKIAIPVCILGMLGAFIGAKISMNIEVGTLRKCFGIFLILIAIYQTYEYIKDKKRHNNAK